MASGSILKLLADREVNGGCVGLTRRELSRMDTRKVSLSHIMDRHGTIAHGHVVLGFSGCGHYIISYCCEVSLAPPTTFYRYSLHWWHFDLNNRLHQVSSYDLFRDELIHCELQLIICQSTDQQHVIALGCRGSRNKDDEHRACYVSILPRPPHPPGTTPTPDHSLSIHFKFDILSPFPSFIPALSLRIPGILLLNTVDSLVAINYHFSTDHSTSWRGRDTYLNAGTAVPQSSGQRSSMVPTITSSRSTDVVLSPGHILQVEVYRGATPLPLLSGPTHQLSAVNGGVTINQSSLDVELWINGVLQAELKGCGLNYRSLMDYDIQLYEVDVNCCNVKFVMVVLLEASKSPKSTVCNYTVDMLGVWNISDGRAKLLHMSELEPALPMVSINWKRTVNLALQLRKACYLHPSTQYTVRAFSNLNVYAGGKSLQALNHPCLPVQLVLTNSSSSSSSRARRGTHVTPRS